MMLVVEAPQQQTQIFRENAPWQKFCLFVMFVLATLIRLDEIKAPAICWTGNTLPRFLRGHIIL